MYSNLTFLTHLGQDSLIDACVILENIDSLGRVFKQIFDLVQFLKAEKGKSPSKDESKEQATTESSSNSKETSKKVDHTTLYDKFLGPFWSFFNVEIPEEIKKKDEVKDFKKKCLDDFCKHLRSNPQIENEFVLFFVEFLRGTKDLDSLYKKLGKEDMKGKLTTPQALDILGQALDLSFEKVFTGTVKKPSCLMAYDFKSPSCIISGELSPQLNTISKMIHHYWALHDAKNPKNKSIKKHPKFMPTFFAMDIQRQTGGISSATETGGTVPIPTSSPTTSSTAAVPSVNVALNPNPSLTVTASTNTTTTTIGTGGTTLSPTHPSAATSTLTETTPFNPMNWYPVIEAGPARYRCVAISCLRGTERIIYEWNNRQVHFMFLTHFLQRWTLWTEKGETSKTDKEVIDELGSALATMLVYRIEGNLPNDNFETCLKDAKKPKTSGFTDEELEELQVLIDKAYVADTFFN
jgi:hypothetical protein